MAKRKNNWEEIGTENTNMDGWTPEVDGEVAEEEFAPEATGAEAEAYDSDEQGSDKPAETNNDNYMEEDTMEENNSMSTEIATTANDGSEDYKFDVRDDKAVVTAAIERAIKDKDEAGIVKTSGNSGINNGLGFTPENINEKFDKMRHKVALYAADDALKKMAPNFTTEKAVLDLWQHGYIAVEETDAQNWFEASFQMNFLGYASQDALWIAKIVEWVVNNYGVGFFPSLPCIIADTLIEMINQYDVVDDKEGIIKSIEAQKSTKKTKRPDRIKWEPGKIWIVLLDKGEMEAFKNANGEITEDHKWLIRRFNDSIKAANAESQNATEPAAAEPTAEQPASTEAFTAEVDASAEFNAREAI